MLALVLAAGRARADRHVVQRGETLEHVAEAYGCDVDALLRVNDLTTTLVPAGTVITVPRCSLHARATSRAHAAPHASAASPDADKAQAALALIDGATWVEPPPEHASPPHVVGEPASTGEPWHGALRGGEHLDDGDGYLVRRPQRAYGAPHVVDHLRRAIAEVRALYPDVGTLAIGDLSAEHGGALAGHRSHQSGLDVDVGFYFRHATTTFEPADRDLDLEATWALVVAFSRTSALDDGVEIIFLDYAVQRRLYDYAKARGTRDDELAFLLQYPAGKDATTGLVRHWPNHADHLHVRFRPASPAAASDPR